MLDLLFFAGIEANHNRIVTPRALVFREQMFSRSNIRHRPTLRKCCVGCESIAVVARSFRMIFRPNIGRSSMQAGKPAILTSAGPITPTKRPSRARLAIAFAVAAVSDFFSIWTEFAPPLQWALDLGTAFVLFLILGRRWALLPGLIAEAIPGMGVFPVWVLVVLSIAIYDGIKKTPIKSRM
jgi:hypothetical protein